MGGTVDGRVQAAGAEDAGDGRRPRAGRPPAQGVQRDRDDLATLHLRGGDDRGEQAEDRVRTGAGEEGDDPPPAAGRVERDAPERAGRGVQPGRPGRHLHDLPGGARAGGVAADEEDPEQDLPAEERPGHPEGDPQGLPAGVEAGGDVRAEGLLRAVPRERLRLREPPDGRGRDLVLLLALGRLARDGGRGQAGRLRRREGGDQLRLRGARGRDPRRQPGLGVGEGAEDAGRQGPPLGPLLRAAAPAPGRRGADDRERLRGEGHPQADGAGRPGDGDVRLAGSVCAAVRRDQQERRGAARGTAEDLRGQPEDGRDPDGRGDGARGAGQGEEQREAPRARAQVQPEEALRRRGRAVPPRERPAFL